MPLPFPPHGIPPDRRTSEPPGTAAAAAPPEGRAPGPWLPRRAALGAALFPAAIAPAVAAGGEAAVVPASPRAGGTVPEDAAATGKSQPLSTRFASLAAAQKVYPHASSLEDEIDWCAIQGAINAAQARGGGAVHLPNNGRGYVLNRGLVLNPNAVTLRGDGTRLDFSRLRQGERAVWFRAEGARAYGHERHVFEGFELAGPGPDAPGINGLYFASDTPAVASRAMVRDCTVHGFPSAVLFGNHAYFIHFEHCSFYECGFCVNCPYGLQDAGETISFSQCALFNSRCLVANMCGFDLKFLACSLDYAQRVVSDNNGLIEFVACRVELAPPRETPFHCNQGRINFFGGFLLVTDPGGHGPLPRAMFALSNPWTSVNLFGLQGWNWRTSTGRLTEGPGKVFLHAGQPIDAPPPDVGHP